MSPAVKGIAGISIPAAGIGGTYLYLKGMNENMPDWKHLKTATDGKFGKDYQLYLADDSDNDDWWKWSFTYVYEPYSKGTNPDFSQAFQGIKDFSGLKSKCKEAYEKTTSSDLTAATSSDDKAKHGRDAWRYCSKFGGKPSTIEDNSGEGQSDKEKIEKDYKDKIGAEKKSELVSVTDNSKVNEEFWKEREKEFFGPKNKNGLGYYSETDKSTEAKKNIFDKLYDNKKNHQPGELKRKCEEVYGQDKSQTTDGKVKDDEAVKYCGLKSTIVADTATVS